MASTELLDSYIDAGALRKETDIFLGQLKELEDQFLVLKKMKIDIQGSVQVGAIAQSVNQASTAMGNFGTQINQVNTAAQSLNQTAVQTVNSTLAQVKSVNQLSTAYDDLVKASVANQLASKKLLEERKKLEASFKSGKIGQDEYLDALHRIKSEQLEITQSNLQLNRAIKNLGKEAFAAEGSLDKLRAQLNGAHQAFDGLSAAEKRSGSGKELLTKIKEINKAISEEEYATGRFQRNVGNYTSALSGMGGTIKGVISQLAAAGVALIGINSIGNFLRDSIDEFNQAEQAASRFKNILDNVGRTDVLNRLNKEADKLAGSFRQLDNDDITQVFTKLVTYGKLTENQIKSLTPVIIDFAAKQGLSLEDASQKIILALEGNGRALKEYGINIKDASTPTEALGLIMTELKPKVEGAAKAFGETTAGQIAISRQEINNLKEDIGNKLQPAVQALYAFISQALAGIPQLFSSIGSGLSNMVSTLKFAGKLTGDLITGDITGALGRIGAANKQKDANEDLIAQEKVLVNLRKQANDIAADASTKPLEEQRRILQSQVALEDASRKNYIELVNSGKKFTEEGRKAGIELLRNKTITQELNKVMKQAADTSVIGGGDPDKRFTKAPKGAKTKVEDTTNDLIAAGEKVRKANEELNKLIITDDANSQERILNNEKNSLEDRLSALDQYMKDKEALIHIDSQLELSNIDAKLSKIKEVEGKPNTARTSAEKKLLTEKEALTAQRVLVEAKTQSQETALVRDGGNKRFDILKSDLDKETRLRLSNFKDQKDADEVRFNNDLIALNDEFDIKRAAATGESEKKKAKIEEEFNFRRLKLMEEFQIAALEKDIKFTEETILLAKLRGEDTTDAENKLSAIRLKQSDLLVKRLEENEGKIVKTTKDKTQEVISALEKISEIYNQITGVISSALDASATSKKNAIQEQIDLLEKRNQKEIEGINNSTLSEEEKAAKIAVLNARANAQKEQYEAKRRQIDQRKAQFDKQAAIGQIIIQTALAVMKAAPVVPLQVLAAALGAAELAIAIATPIPKYRQGKGAYDNYEGPAIWGDGGISEMRISKDGRLEMSPSTPALTFVKSTDKIHPDANEFLRGYANMAVRKTNVQSPGSEQEARRLEQTLKKELRGVKSAIEGQVRVRVTNTYKGVQTSFDTAHRHWQWVNKNMG